LPPGRHRADADADAYIDAKADADADIDADADAHADIDAHADTHADANPDSFGVAGADADAHADTHADANADAGRGSPASHSHSNAAATVPSRAGTSGVQPVGLRAVRKGITHSHTSSRAMKGVADGPGAVCSTLTAR
jgi:hypothetical protein